MAVQPDVAPASTQSATFESLNPATGEVVATLPIHGEAEVRAAVDRAREAATWWGALDFGARRRHLHALVAELVHGADELAELLHRENGKPIPDAKLEIVGAAELLAWDSRNAKRVLGLRKVRSTPLMFNHAAYLEYQPLGVIGAIGPWNYPVFTPMGTLGSALSAGNTVVFKPSEYTPAVGVWLAEAAQRAIPEHPVLQAITGFGETGAHLCRSGVDKIAFTGSAATGRKILAACAGSLTPVVLELGGKDVVIIAEDADLERAARATVWGALQNAGQACVSTERVYVVDKVYDEFVEKVVAKAAEIRAGSDGEKIGPITMPGQVDIIRRHVDDALARGAKAVVGGPESLRGGPWIEPIILTDVPADSPALTEETFGPTLPIVRVRDVDEAVELSNRSEYGLGSSIFGKKRALELARKIKAGATSINAVVAFAGMSSLPFGGRKESGFGRIHGDDGLREFSMPKAITKQRIALPTEYTSFERPDWVDKVALKTLQLKHRKRRTRRLRRHAADAYAPGPHG